MIASEFASALDTIGAPSRSLGSCLAACDTLSLTSLAALSKFAERSNSTEILEVP